MEQNIPVYVYAIEHLSHTPTPNQSCILILGENWPFFTVFCFVVSSEVETVQSNNC